PSSSVTPRLTLTHIPANVEGVNATNTGSKEPPSHTEGETGDVTMAIPISSIQPTHDQPITLVISYPESSHVTLRIDKGKGTVTESDKDPQKDWCLVLGYRGKMKKAAEEAKLLAMSRPEVIKVVREEAKKHGIDPKEAISTKAGETFKKAQDAEHEVLKREHSKKVKQLTKLNRWRAEEYMWTMTNRIKPERITDVGIHPNTKPIVASVFGDNDKRNFDVQQPFKFSNFRYERLKKIPEELRIQSALPALIPEQALSQSSGRKRKHMELEPQVKVPGLECNRSLPEGVLLRDDIYKVGVDSLVSYLVMASMVKTEENARFSLKLRKMIADHPDQDKLKSKKVKLEALRYHVE
ncbi:hypothetical protein Tco_0709572, partial [Tanacetum coccineum]